MGTVRQFQVLLLVEASRVYGRDIIEGVAKFATEQSGTWFVQFQDKGGSERPPLWLKEWEGDGIIARSTSAKMESLLRVKKIPYVELCGARGLPEVVCDDVGNGRMAVEHFLERGLKQFAFFGIGKSWWVRWRCDNYRKALASLGYDCQIFIQKQNSKSVFPTWNRSNEAALIRWLTNLPKPIGLYCDSDIHSSVVVNACRKGGIRIPWEVAVLGVDNDKTLCGITNPRISCIATNGYQVGYLAAELLHRRMIGREVDVIIPILVPSPYIVTRESTDIVAIDEPDVAEAIRYIRQFATTGISVTDVENHVSVSHATLFRKFRKFLGHSPEKEIIRVKVSCAERLLLETSLSLQQIAQRSGITPLSYFVRVFRRERNITPQAFRGRHIGRSAE